MSDPALVTLTWRVVRRRVLASRAAIAAAVLFPALVALIGLRDSYAAAMRFFLFFFPHAFLFAAQDMVRTDIDGGALENVLFLAGRFRGFLWAKNLVLAAAVAAYAAGLFTLLAAWGAARGGFEAVHLAQFGLGLLAGLYYVALAGTLSHFLKAGSNAAAVLLGQAAVFVALLFSVTSRTGFLDHAAAGRFPGPGPALLFGGLVAVLPNVIVSPKMSVFGAEVLAGLVLALFVQGRLVRRLELRK
jgi:hypothetical protein